MISFLRHFAAHRFPGRAWLLALLLAGCGPDRISGPPTGTIWLHPEIRLGKALGRSEISSLDAVVSGDHIAGDTVYPLLFEPLTGKFSGSIRVPPQGNEWLVRIRVFDTLGHKIAQGERRVLAAQSHFTVTIASRNAVPSADAGRDTSLSLNDTILLRGQGADPLGGTLVEWAWDPGGEGLFSVTGQSAAVRAPSTGHSRWPVVLRVTDDDGNRAFDTFFVNVMIGRPWVTLDSVPEHSIRDSVVLRFSAGDQPPGRIARAEWKIGASPSYAAAGRTDTTIRLPADSSSAFPCIIRVTDDDSNSVGDTIWFAIVRDAPVLTLSPDTAVPLGSTLLLRASATQDFGSIISQAWQIGAGAPFRPVSTGDTIIQVPSAWLPSPVVCTYQAIDDDSNRVEKSLSLTPGRWGPLATHFIGVVYDMIVRQYGNTGYVAYQKQNGAWGALCIRDSTITLLGMLMVNGDANRFKFILSADTPYAAYSDISNSGNFVLKRNTGGTWETVPVPAAVRDRGYQYQAMTVSNGKLYFVYYSGTGLRVLSVQETTCVQEGPEIPCGLPSGVEVNADSGMLHVAMLYSPQPSWPYRLELRRLQLNSWINPGAEADTLSGNLPGQFQIYGEEGDPIKLEWHQQKLWMSTRKDLAVLDGGTWTWIHPPAFTLQNPKIALVDGVPYLVSGQEIYAFWAGTWQRVGSPDFTIGQHCSGFLSLSGKPVAAVGHGYLSGSASIDFYTIR